PSGAALATCWAASTVLAPGRFSTKTGWPQSSFIFWPIIRARTSEGPPAGNCTTILIARVGNASGRFWAAAVPAITADKIASAIEQRFMTIPSEFDGWVRWAILTLALIRGNIAVPFKMRRLLVRLISIVHFQWGLISGQLA